MYGGNIYASVEYASRQRLLLATPIIIVGPFVVQNLYGEVNSLRNYINPEAYKPQVPVWDYEIRANTNS